MKPLLLSFLLPAVVLAAQAQAPLYQLNFEAGSLANSGSLGGTAQARQPAGASAPFAVSADSTLPGWIASLGLTTNGQRGVSIVLPASQNQLRLTGPNDELSLCLWVKWNGPHGHADTRQGLVSNQPLSKNKGWAFSILSDGKLQFDWVGAAPGGNRRKSVETVSRGRWTQVALTWKNQTQNGGLAFYINGQTAGISQEWTGGGPVSASDRDIQLGVMDSDNYLPLNGSIAQVQVYDQALAAPAIHKLMLGPKRIFAHYMMAIPPAGGNASVADYKAEILKAQTAGIDGFALNAGGWTIENKTPSYKERTGRMYQAAKELNTGFKLFISADFASHLSFGEFVDMVESFRGHPSQFYYQGKPVISTFRGELNNLTALSREEFSGERAISLVPFYFPTPASELPTQAQITSVLEANRNLPGFFYFGAAGAPDKLAEVVRRMSASWHQAGKVFMAPVTPYYRGRGGNFRAFESRGFEGMALAWETAIAAESAWVELVTWNDWNECSYVAPFAESGSNNLWNGHFGRLLSHNGFIEASRYYMDWFKSGQKPAITEDAFYYFYRVHPKSVPSPAGLFPAQVEKLEDNIHATLFLVAPARFTIQCGEAAQSYELTAGVHHVAMPMTIGTPRFTLNREGVTVMDKEGELSISPDNTWGNFNYFAASSKPAAANP